ncbi:tetratricopeptide repeat protein [Bradymonas sediminis]|uniref:Uncharacterized protein n=1 Tax=Bradymonas sediminis TaxID=1548548 RepID=A0A2Z4FK14_9DELT|nr:tetratricopeptide repeat protein [Bradymonas sediminis]AWV89289.1 hypothetical protein DN745_08040 [Bradymonas sediminis]TDP73462.1 tetratricopeptide repeat protein [Bradymonas sediminis]
MRRIGHGIWKLRAQAARATLIFSLLVTGVACATTGELDEPRDPPRIEKLRLQITKVRNAVDTTRHAVARARGADYSPELYVRLAELLSEEARYHYQLAYEREQGASRSMTVPQVRLLKEDAIEIYERVLRDFPESPLAPRVLFNIGQEQRELGNFDEMQSAMRRLVEKYPKSPLRFDALLVLGDYHFDKQNFTEAEKFYAQIVDAELNRHDGIAHYKRAWIRMNRGDCKSALVEFEGALENAKAWDELVAKRAAAQQTAQGISEQVGTQQDIDVRRESLVDMAYCYSREKPFKGALAYFQDHAYNRATYLAAVSRLAARYRMMGKYGEAADTSRELLALGAANDLHLDDARSFYSALKQQKSYDNIGQDTRLIANMVFGYYSRPTIAAEERERLVAEFETYTRDLLTSAQEVLGKNPDHKTRSKKKIAQAQSIAAGYDVYLDAFPASEHRAEMLLNMAEVLSDAQQPFEAGRRANEAAALLEDATTKQNALYDAVVYLQESLRTTRDPSKYRRVTARATLRNVGSQLLGFDIEPDKARRVKFAIAQTFYDEGQYNQAIDRLTAVAYEFPQTEEADAAVHLTLDSYNTLNDFDGLMYASRRFLAEGSPISAGVKGEVQGILAAAEQRKLDELSLEAAGEDGGGLDQLIHFAEQNPSTEVGERALINAFVAARAVGDTAKVYEMANQIAEKYPQSEQLPGIYSSLAQTANTRFEFNQAIDYLKRAAQVNEDQRTLILTAAAELEAELGRTASAQGTYETAVRKSKEEARDIALSGLAILLERNKSASEMVAALQPYKSSSEPEYQARLGLAYLASGDAESAETAFSEVLVNEASASPGALGRAHYGMAELMRLTVESYPAPSDLDMLQELIALIDLTQQSYLQAARQGSPTMTAVSLSRLAVASEMAAKKFLNIRLPDSISVSDKKDILDAMKARSEALNDAAQQALEACGEQAYSSYNFSRVVRQCLQNQKLTTIMIPMDPIKEDRSNPDGGFEQLRGELAKNPEDLERLATLGKHFFEKQNYHAARLVYKKAVDAGGGSAVLNELGRANEAVGDLGGALNAYALAAEAGFEPARKNLKKVLNTYSLGKVADKFEARLDGSTESEDP